MQTRALFLIPALACAACRHPRAPTPVAPPTISWRLDHTTFDPGTSACQDFYQYACGGYATPASIPGDRGVAEWATDRADAANDHAVHELLAGSDASPDPERARLRTFYASCMAADRDTTATATLHGWLARIDAIATRDDVLAIDRELQRIGIDALFSYAGAPDATDRTRYRGEIDIGAVGSRRLYADTGAAADARRADYVAHIAAMFELAGLDATAAAHDAHAVFELDASLAAAEPARSDDPLAEEHPMSRAALTALAPHLAWPTFLDLAGQPPHAAVNVTAPAYLAAVDAAVATRPIADLRADLRWQLLRALGPALPGALADEHYRFDTLSGVARGARADECRLETLKALGVELSHQFARDSIGAAARDRARPIADRVRTEIVRSLGTLSWLSPGARAVTADKIATLALKIGFPDRWPASGTFALGRDTFLDNVLAARRYEQQRSWARARAVRTRDSWENIVYPNAASGMAAARLTIPNGFPDILSNSIVFTAAFLRPPLFDANAPPEVSYGGFGAVVGHELVHVIEQHAYDKLGELHETWSPDDLRAHDDRRACVVAQANDAIAFDATHVDGEQTYDENVADLSGVAYAYAAMSHELGPRVTERGADGHTRAQRFFIAYAQRYCLAARPAWEHDNLRADPHAPVRYRVNGPLANLPAFATAFGCAPDAPMVRPARARCAMY